MDGAAPASADAPPRARVAGEPFTAWPADLYIPPQALEVFLESFEGPLDLLLYLIRRQNIDIRDIPVARVSEQYVAYIRLMHELQLDLAGEYLLMAALLTEIKSRMLLPSAAADEDGADEEDPRAELVRRLEAYERLREAAEQLDTLPRLGRDVLSVTLPASGPPPPAAREPLTVAALQAAMLAIQERQRLQAHHRIDAEPLSVRERMQQLLRRLQATGPASFVRLLDPAEGREGVVVTLLALLELARERCIRLQQGQPGELLHISPLP